MRREEVSGLQAALAIEGALTAAIAQADKSVVAIARVSRSDREEVGALELRPDPFGALRIVPAKSEPGDPDFVPNDFATGVVVDRRGLILTNYHVLADDSDYYVTTVERQGLSGRAIKAADPRSDLAVLTIDAHDLSPIKFGDAANLKKGPDRHRAGQSLCDRSRRPGQRQLGNHLQFRTQGAAHAGRKSAVRRQDDTLHQFGTLIQTDAKLNLGTSGGALVNLQGEMIGLTTAFAAMAGYEQAAGYAIPVDDTFRRVVETLKQGREVEYGFLGVAPESLRESDILAGRHGVRVREVIEGRRPIGLACALDDVITHVNGRPIYDADGLVLQVGKLPAEAVVRLTVERDGEVLPVNAELTKYAVRGKKIVTTPAASLARNSGRLCHGRSRFQRSHATNGKIDPHGCVLITEVEEYSPAWNQGLRADMAITHVGNRPVNSPERVSAQRLPARMVRSSCAC